MAQESPARSPNQSADKWAPWWVYLIVILGANYVRHYFVPMEDMATPIVVAIAVTQAAILFGIITVIWRLKNPPSS